MADGTARDDRSSEEIRRDIQRTRAEMDDTADRLEDRLSPGRLLDEVWSRVRDRGNGNAVADVLRDHPVPFALMGLGLGWLAVEQASGRSASPDGHDRKVSPGTWAPAEGRRGPYGPEAVDGGDEGGAMERAKQKMTGAKEAASGAAGAASDIKDRASDAASAARDKTAEVSSRASESMSRGMSSAAGEARKKARQASHGMQRMMDENPLALGAIAFGLGLAGGISVPSSRTEDRMMGHTADTVKDEGRRMATDAAQSTARVAGEAASAAKEEARRQGQDQDLEEPVRELAHRAQEGGREVARAARDAARERAEEEGLTAEDMKDEVRSAGERTKESAREQRGARKQRPGGSGGSGSESDRKP